MKALLQYLNEWRRPYRVTVEWGWDTLTHRGATLEEALEWVAAYPRETLCTVHTRRGVWVTTRAGGL